MYRRYTVAKKPIGTEQQPALRKRAKLREDAKCWFCGFLWAVEVRVPRCILANFSTPRCTYHL